jgi:hypothetical protein
MTYTTLKRGGDGPDPVGIFPTYAEAWAYKEWAEREEDCEYEVVSIADASPLYGKTPEPPPITCPQCGGSSFEKRGERRTYHPLGADLDEDSWDHGEVTLDVNDNGDDVIYCNECDSEFSEDELRAAQEEKSHA